MILFLAGTSDARELAVLLKEKGYPLVATVVTDSAATSLREQEIETRVGRLPLDEMVSYSQELGVAVIVDATHPFAEEASKNAMAAAEQLGVPYLRYERETRDYINHPLVQIVPDYEAAALAAKERKGVIMLTTGSKTLGVFTKHLLGDPDIRLVARMLPRLDNMEKCEALGVPQKNIVAMQGPFSKELNAALYQHYGVDVMITKESGQVGAVDEKLEAALEMNIFTIMIDRPKLAYGASYSSFDDVLVHLIDKYPIPSRG
ncbi:precorrin-6A reductase [Brevibacillus fluminis]|uniref:Precorrin-6A reductase n=1 Tax=Brevibacillus fluminis TaxID=511487 RepID=A0A3M8DQ42_9BACL|nr:precorrin-6A reductase [Brevibacillus fluminis]RNB89639.1 precorrin-6A reductase [Brevibacillus fluminis]